MLAKSRALARPSHPELVHVVRRCAAACGTLPQVVLDDVPHVFAAESGLIMCANEGDTMRMGRATAWFIGFACWGVVLTGVCFFVTRGYRSLLGDALAM